MGQMADYQATDGYQEAVSSDGTNWTPRPGIYNGDFAAVGPVPRPIEMARDELDRRHKNVLRMLPGLSYTDAHVLALLSLVRAETGAARDEFKNEVARLRLLVERIQDRPMGMVAQVANDEPAPPAPPLVPEAGTQARANMSPVKWDGTQRNSRELLDPLKTRRKLQMLAKAGVLGASEQLERLQGSGRLQAHAAGRKRSRALAKPAPKKVTRKKTAKRRA